jgi:hypothetical protein
LLLKSRERAITDQSRAESFLRRCTGLFFRAACLPHEIGVTAFEGPPHCGPCNLGVATKCGGPYASTAGGASV